MKTQIDLFENVDLLPSGVSAEYLNGATYDLNERFLAELKPLGYEFEYGLDAEPYDLRKIYQIKTIDIIALEWFDKVNGNSYFAGTITVNFGLPDVKEFKMPFQYGYGDHYKDMAFKQLEAEGIIKDREKYEMTGGSEAGWRYCDRKGIVLRSSKRENCKKKELKNL